MLDGLSLSQSDSPLVADTRRPLIIDSFAGGGGASTGIEAALGRSPDVAINHSEAAIAMHAANHPDTEHLIASVYSIDPRDVVATGQRVGLLWASPDCKHFSRARGGTPVNKNIRGLAEVVLHWAKLVRPEVILLENVAEFTTYGPLRQKYDGPRPPEDYCADLLGQEAAATYGKPVFNDDGTPFMEPDKERAGEYFDRLVNRFRNLGYAVEWRVLRACDYGAPTIRQRLFMVFRCDGRPIVWPEPTHGDPASDEVKRGALKPWRTAAECIDWTLPCPSIFDTREQIKAKHGLRAKRPLADATLARIARGLRRYVLDADQPFLVNLTHGGRTEAVSDPFRTITGANRGEKAVVAPHMMTMRNAGKPFNGADEPTHTITAEGAHLFTVSPSLTRFNGGATGQDLRDPLATITANSWIKKPGGAAHPAVLAGGGHSAVVVPTLIQTGYGERAGQAPRVLDLGNPLGTVVAGGAKHSTAAAFLAQHHTQRSGVHSGRDARGPLSTIAASGSHQTPVAAWMAKYYGTDQTPELDQPMHTATTKDRFGHLQANISAPPFTPEHETKARQVADLMRAHGEWDDREFVTVDIQGETFVVVDIGLRMLTPRELYRAQGFPEDYVIEGTWAEDGDDWQFHPFDKSTQISNCGNSVPPVMAEALAAVNCGHLMETALETTP